MGISRTPCVIITTSTALTRYAFSTFFTRFTHCEQASGRPVGCMPLKSARNYTDFIVVLSKSGSNISQPFLSWYQKSECKPESIINPRRMEYAKHYRLYGPL